MGIIAVGGRKGGIGKSTIARGNLAGEFAAMGRSVAVLDADPQHSLAAWAAQGEGMFCEVRGTRGKRERRGSSGACPQGREDGRILVIDTPPGITETLYDAAMVADIVLLPCGPSPLDLFALKDALSLTLKARAERRSKKPRRSVSCLRGSRSTPTWGGFFLLAREHGQEGAAGDQPARGCGGSGELRAYGA